MASEKKFIANALFRQRALAEAARYGSDPWVFVRELLQNARDAGARRVTFTTSANATTERMSCRDDGGGMSLEHAQRYLFALYASSKEDRAAEAGKFGIGFWSVLRFEPSAITVRSRTGAEAAWEVALDGQLEWATVRESVVESGTEVVLEREAPGLADETVDLGEEIFAAAVRYGRFLTCREGAADRPAEPLRVLVDGRPANAELTLPAPCATFRGPGFRGAVGLGKKPRVELFAHGLFVRSADSLQELAEDGEEPRNTAPEDALADLPSVAPQVLLDSTELDLLLARSDARQDRHLRRMLRVAEKALDRLITRQLHELRPQPWYGLWWSSLRDRLEPLLASPRARGSVAVAAGAAVLAFLLVSFQLPEPQESGSTPLSIHEVAPPLGSAGPAVAIGDPSAASHTPRGGRLAGAAGIAARRTPAGTSRPRGYSDLSRRYRGPVPESLGASSMIALSYEPAQPMLFTALVIERFEGFRWDPEPLPAELPPYRGATCAAGCVDVELLLDDSSGPLRIPVPTGHRLDVSSLRLGGLRAPVYEAASGEALLNGGELAARLLEYRTGPAPAPAGPRPRPARRFSARAVASPDLLRIAAAIRHEPLPDLVQSALRYVASHIRYDRSLDATRAYARDPRDGFAATALAAGAGDCDVQNGVLVELLRLAGVEARLALGYVGIDGAAAAGLHAWAEYLDGDGRWRAADASVIPPPAEDSSALAAARSRATGPEGKGAAPEGLPVDMLAGAVPGAPRELVPALAVLTLLLAAGGAVSFAARRRTTASLDLDPAGNLAELLGGALRHPGAFAALPAISHGRFIPLLGRAGAISLDRARRLVAERRLFRSSAGSRLALDAVARGVPVVDSGTPEGRVLSLALGAVDLDRWSELLERSAEDGLGRRINLLLLRLGEPWRVRAAFDLAEPLLELALEDLGLGQRVVLIDPGHEVFAPAVRLHCERPDTATFSALDLILHRLELDERDRARLLAAAARQAMREASR